jgi:hypothetical protein
MRRPCRSFLAIAFMLSLALVGPALAAPVEINSRAALGGDDFIDWGTLGPPGTSLGVTFMVTSNGGLGATVSSTATPFGASRRNQGPMDWNGSFALGDELLFSGFSGVGTARPTVTIQFSTPVAGAGAQIEDAFLTGVSPYIAGLQVFGSANTLLASFTETGISTEGSANNSAIFLGVLNDAANIDHITYRISEATNALVGFALNQLDIVTTPRTTPVPEPGIFLLLVTSLAGIGVLHGAASFASRRRRSARTPEGARELRR